MNEIKCKHTQMHTYIHTDIVASLCSYTLYMHCGVGVSLNWLASCMKNPIMQILCWTWRVCICWFFFSFLFFRVKICCNTLSRLLYQKEKKNKFCFTYCNYNFHLHRFQWSFITKKNIFAITFSIPSNCIHSTRNT